MACFTTVTMIGGLFLSINLVVMAINIKLARNNFMPFSRTISLSVLSEVIPYWSANHGDTVLFKGNNIHKYRETTINDGSSGLSDCIKWPNRYNYSDRMICLNTQ
jgi:hypothetical protein